MKQKRIVICFFTIILLSCILGCGDDGIFEKKSDLSGYTPPSEYEFSALDFPSANGSSWTYLETELEIEYTVKIEGVRNIGGKTCRRVKHQLLGAPVDFLSANGFYVRLDGEYLRNPFPISATYLQKTMDYYTEYAFEVCTPSSEDPCIDAEDSEGSSIQHNTIKQEHFPPRKLWKFPIQVGSEWTVFKQSTPQTITVVRNVAEIVSVNTPSGSYSNAYLVQERLYFGDPKQQEDKKPDALYWLVPEIGVVKYQYYDYTTQSSEQSPLTRTFVLKEWQEG